MATDQNLHYNIIVNIYRSSFKIPRNTNCSKFWSKKIEQQIRKERSVNCIEMFGYFEKTFDEKKIMTFKCIHRIHIAKYMQSNRFSFLHICVHTQTHTHTYMYMCAYTTTQQMCTFESSHTIRKKTIFSLSLSRSSNATLNAETWDTICVAMKNFYSKSLQFFETTTTLHLLDCM